MKFYIIDCLRHLNYEKEHLLNNLKKDEINSLKSLINSLETNYEYSLKKKAESNREKKNQLNKNQLNINQILTPNNNNTYFKYKTMLKNIISKKMIKLY
jgi:hypothetical protein